MAINPPPDLSQYESQYGSMFFSIVVATAFYGVTCMQIFYYFVNYHGDPMRMKCLVVAFWTISTIHESLIISGAYKFLIRGLTHPQLLYEAIPELILLSMTLVAVPTQGYFVYRIYLFSERNIYAPLAWVLLGGYQAASTLLYVWKSLYVAHGGIQAVQLAQLNERFFRATATARLCVAAGADALIAVTLTSLLLQKRNATSFERTAHVLQRLTLFAVHSGFWTAASTILAVILMNVLRSNVDYAVFGIPLCAVYCNTLLANINARAYIRGETTRHEADTEPVMMSRLSTERSKRLSVGHRQSMVVAFPDAELSNTSENVQSLRPAHIFEMGVECTI